jgi:hypothetical protein
MPEETGWVIRITRGRIELLITLLFVLNAALLVWMAVLPGEWALIRGAIPEWDNDSLGKVPIENLSVSADGLKEIAGARYAYLYRKHALACKVAWVVLLLDACFIFAVGVFFVCIEQQMKRGPTTEPPVERDAQARTPQQ